MIRTFRIFAFLIVVAMCLAMTSTQIDLSTQVKNAPGGNGAILFNNSGGLGGSAATITATGEIASASTYSNAIGAFGIIKLSPTYTGTFGSSAIYQTGIDTEVTQNPSADSAIIAVAVKGVTMLKGSHNFTFTGGEPSAGGEFFSFMEGSGTAPQVTGLIAAAGSTSGTLANAYAFQAQSGTQGSGTITNDYTAFIQSPNTLSVITNHYGLYIDDQTVGGSNNPNPYAIYQVAGRNFFGGPSTFGSTVSGPTLIESSTLSPTSASTAGTTGQIAWDTNFIYICTQGGSAGSATWKKVALSAD